jgi:hypothetical protein
MNGRRLNTRFVLMLGLAGVAVPSVHAAADAPSASDLARCAAMSAADARLACYDALALSTPSSATAASAPSAPTAPAPDARSDAKTFGLPPPAPVAAPEVPSQIRALVTQVYIGRPDGGSISVFLDNGQTWLVESPELQLKVGDSVTIKRAALGSYIMTAPGRRSYRVRRLM